MNSRDPSGPGFYEGVFMKNRMFLSAGIMGLALAILSCQSVTAESTTTPAGTLSGGASFQTTLTSLDTSLFTPSDWANGSMFYCGWSPSNVSFDASGMTFTLNHTASHGLPYASGEIQSKITYGHGLYTVSMKPAKASGIVSSFFLYTGNPWDEIDIEFLGKDTTKVQFNYFVNGVGNHEHVYDLGFDASQSFHTYGIEFLSNGINWYVDGNKVYSVTSGPLPTHAMQVMANLWPGTGVDSWLGTFSYASPLMAQYKSISYKAQQ